MDFGATSILYFKKYLIYVVQELKKTYVYILLLGATLHIKLIISTLHY